MKRKRIWIIALACVVVVAVGLASWHFVCRAMGEKPFADLEASDIQQATVTLSPPDETYYVVELKELVSHLQDLVIYEEDNSYTEYAGQGVIYTLTMADGTERTVTAYNPFLIVDGVGYRTKHEPCEALSRYGNKIAEDTTVCEQLEPTDVEYEPEPPEPPVPLTEPPVLCAISGSGSIDALRGGYSWTIYHEDGTAEATIADSAHPLDCQNMLTCLETTEPTALLEFQIPPAEITEVRCWSDAEFGNSTAESEAVEVDGWTITLLPGGHVYEVTARWEGEDYEGSASYSFWINLVP